MSGKITISPEEVLAIAGNIEKLNNQLDDTLKSTQAQVTGLQGSWTGDAASATIDAFNSFANKYFENYKQLLQAYVTFLKQNVSASYASVGKINTSLADLIQ